MVNKRKAAGPAATGTGGERDIWRDAEADQTATVTQGNNHPIFRPGWGDGRWPLATYDQVFETRATCAVCGGAAWATVELDSDLACTFQTARPVGGCSDAGCCVLVEEVEHRTVWQLATAHAGGAA